MILYKLENIFPIIFIFMQYHEMPIQKEKEAD